jgi:tagatose-1,6-bisphosphate aldolase
MTTLGKYRHLAQCSTDAGHFCILAIDHRDNLRAKLDKPMPISDAEFRAFKSQVMAHLLPESSAVLADPEFGFGPGIAGDVIGGGVGVLSPLEVTNYDVHPSQRQTDFIEGWSVAKIKRMGGSGVKLLLYYNPEADAAAAKRDLVSKIVEDCATHDIPFFLEPIAYALDPEISLSDAELRQIVVENAKVLSNLGIDVLKTEFPVNNMDESEWAAALYDLNAACAVPWALLSAGVDFATFRKQAEFACNAGASGVMVGRAVWAEAVQLRGAARDSFLRVTGRERMAQLAAVCKLFGADWRVKVAAPVLGENWYSDYGKE